MVFVLVGVFGLLGGQLAVAPEAHAAGTLVNSDPAPREELKDAPGGVTLAFSRTVEKAIAKIRVVDSSGRNHVKGEIEYFGSSLAVYLDAVPAGTYTVMYRIDRPDGEPEGGAFQFAVGKGEWTQVTSSWSGQAEQPTEMASPDPTESPVPTEPATSAGTPAPSPGSTGVGTAAPTAEPTPGQSTPAFPWLNVLIGVVVVGVGAGVAAVWWSRRRRS